MPAYPPMAREQRIQGTVRFTATIGKDGRVKNLEFISGNPVLVKSGDGSMRTHLNRFTIGAAGVRNGESEPIPVIRSNLTVAISALMVDTPGRFCSDGVTGSYLKPGSRSLVVNV